MTATSLPSTPDGKAHKAKDSQQSDSGYAANPHLETLDCIDARMVELDLLEQLLNREGVYAGPLHRFKLERLADLEKRRKAVTDLVSADPRATTNPSNPQKGQQC